MITKKQVKEAITLLADREGVAIKIKVIEEYIEQLELGIEALKNELIEGEEEW
jgi:hypothetical protein